MTARLEDVLLATSLTLVGLSATTLWLLSRPTSWLSRWVDGQIARAFVVVPS